MTNRLPLTILNGRLRELQTGEDLDISNNNITNIQTLEHFAEYDNGNLGGGANIDFSLGKYQTGTLTDNCLLSISNFPGQGSYYLRLKQDGNNSWTIQWTDGGAGIYFSNRWVGFPNEPQINLSNLGETLITFVLDDDGIILYQAIEYVNQQTGFAISAGSQSASAGVVTFVNSNGITLFLGPAGKHIEGTAYPATHSMGISNVGNTDGTSGVATGSNIALFLVGGSNVTLSQSFFDTLNGTISISGGGMNLGMSTGGNTSGSSVTPFVNAQYLFAGGNNVTLSQSVDGAFSSGTITISIPGLLNAYEPSGGMQFARTSSGYPFASLAMPWFAPMIVPQNIAISEVYMMVSMLAPTTSTDNGSNGQDWGLGIYKRVSNSTTQLSLLTSTYCPIVGEYYSNTLFGWTFGGTSGTTSSSIGGTDILTQISGLKMFNLPLVTTLSAGEYFIAGAIYEIGSSGGGNLTIAGPIYQRNFMSSIGRIGVVPNASVAPMMGLGVYTTTVWPFPATVGFSQLAWSSGINQYLKFVNNGAQ